MKLEESDGYRSRSRKRSAQKSKYRILDQIGQGQFGRVFCGVDRQTGEIAALKELSHDSSPTKKFLQELWSAIAQEHPNIVTCQTLEHTATGRYLVMDYCEGGTLRHLLEQDKPLRLAEGLQLIVGILAGLESVHQRGMVHCDIKPENILLTLGSDGWIPRLSDFGIALQFPQSKKNSTSQGDAMMGSPGYMAPERFYGLYSPASDIYAVGIILYEMLMGDRPFKGFPGKLMWAHLNERSSLPPSVPDSLRALVQKSLEKLPARRFASAADMAAAVQQAADEPLLKHYSARRLPWETSAEAILLKPLSESYRKIVPVPLSAFASSQSTLYGAAGCEVMVWNAPRKPPARVSLPERARSLQAQPQGCLVLTERQLYWIGAGQYRAEMILDVSPSPTNLSKSPSPCRGGEEVSPPSLIGKGAGGLGQFAYTAAVSPQSRWLAVAIASELRFYSLSQLQSGAAAPLRSIRISEATLPELIFLDERHLLAIWYEATSHQTRLKVYARRGHEMVSLSLPVQFLRDKSDRSLTLADEPYTLFGIDSGPKPAAYRIQLKPWQVKRIPLEGVPACWAVFGKEYVVAYREGEIMFFDSEGRSRALKGPKAPRAIAAWGKKSLAIAARDGEQGYLYCTDVEAGRRE